MLAGDVMTGRGVDQILPSPGAPALHEEYVVDARSYVELAEQVNGSIPSPVDPGWPWGEALAVMDDFGPAVRVMNLETSVTRSDDFAVGKAVQYRMNPSNVPCLVAARTDVWTLANNHVLDYGVLGLLETLDSMREAGLRTVGAGRDHDEAWSPAALSADGRRVVVCSVGHRSSGVPRSWAATVDRPGVAVLPDLSDAEADALAERMQSGSQPGDIRVVSIHWGANWGYSVPHEQRRFAHRLVDAGVHVVHGHSSHHPRPAEVYRGRLVLYGCGDLVNDYEGIGGYGDFRDELRLVYLARLDDTGGLQHLRMVPLRARRMTLELAAAEDARWMAHRLDDVSRDLGSGVTLTGDASLSLRFG